MKIKYDEFLIEDLDDNNYIVSRVGTYSEKSKREGEEKVERIGYFATIDSAVAEVARLSSNKSDSLSDWLEEYRKVVKAESWMK